MTRQRGAMVAAAAAVLLTACGGGDDKGTSAEVASLSGGTTTTVAGSGADASEEDFQEAMLDYAACMREHGVDMDDPRFDSDGRVTMRVGGEDGDAAAGGSGAREDPDFADAEEACRDIIESVRGEFQPDEEQQAEMQESLLAFAECMRGEGIDYPDPQFDSDGRPVFDPEEDRRMQFDPDDPEFRAAQDKCQEELGEGAGLRIGGPAGGGGGPQRERGGGDEEGSD